MSASIIKLGDAYLLWSTVVDAPTTRGLSLVELRRIIKKDGGDNAMRDLPARMERVEATGTSAYGETVEGVISVNRAGPGECELTRDEIEEFYVRRKGLGMTAAALRRYRTKKTGTIAASPDKEQQASFVRGAVYVLCDLWKKGVVGASDVVRIVREMGLSKETLNDRDMLEADRGLIVSILEGEEL